MNCQECENLFDDMIDRHVKEPVRRRMELHLSRCGICRGKLEHRKRSHALMFRALNHADGILHLPKDFADRLVAECRRQPKRSFFPSLPRWALLAASLAIVAGFVFAAVETFEALSAPDAAARDESPRPSDQPPPTQPPPTQPPNQPPTNQLPTNQLPTNQPPTYQGEAPMTGKKAATAALAATMTAAPLAAASGDEYQFIHSGDPVAAATAGSSAASSAPASITRGTLADGFVLASDLEARSRTTDESAATALRSDKFKGTFLIFK